MLALLVVHVIAYAVAPLLVRVFGRHAFWVLALPNAVTAVWAIGQAPAIQRGESPTQLWQWIPSIAMTIDLRMDMLSWVLTLIISIIGVLVLCYCAGYFDNDEIDLERFAAHLTAFSGVMLGLVWSDNLLLLYLFWELTTVLSYLLVGHLSHKQESRQAATQALVVTTFGGLAMLVGMVMIGLAAGTYRLSEIMAAPPDPGPVVAAAIVLILIGAISKSALVPFHFWLPGAMAAPTPVSAYLHAAAMVKAGIYLVARFAPGFADRQEWQLTCLVLGGATMIIGGYRALRQHDLKLLLAYGTVSQLGFLVILFGWGTPNAALAGLTMLIAHAVFKASLFLAVGAIDHATGTRDLRVLDGLGRRMPVLAVTSTLAAASMAGVPPLLGFVGKEAAYASLLHGEGPFSQLMLGVIFTGSVLTFAYAARFVWGAWGPGSEAEGPTETHANPWVVTAPPVLLGVLGLLLAPPSALAEPMFALYTDLFPAEEYTAHLGLWHGFNAVLLLSLLTLALGAVLYAIRIHVEHWQRTAPHIPAAVSAYRGIMRGLDRISLEVTGLLHRGSLPLSLSLILVVLITIPGTAMVLAAADVIGAGVPVGILLFESPGQLAIAILAIVAALAAVNSLRRFRAVFLVGVTGYASALLFLLHGAPDLALTQVLVETVSLVVFVLVLRRFSAHFPDAPSGGVRTWRILLGVLTGLVFTGVALVAPMARTAPPDSTGMPQSAVEFGGGYNIVNVILVDIRAWDTMGEISVVLVAATGVASLVFLQSTNLSRVRLTLAAARTKRFERTGTTIAEVGWLSEVRAVPNERRSLMFEVVTRLIFHAVMLWSLYLLFTGHNDPGGGFAGGLVAGLGLTIRYLAGGAAELRAAMPVMPGALLGSGLFLSAGFGVVSMLAGGQVLQSWTFDIPAPLIGNIHIVTSMFFDIGVYLVVVGLMLDILRSLGSALDYRIAESEGRVVNPGTYEPMGERR